MNVYIKILICAVAGCAAFMIPQLNSLQSRLEASNSEIAELKMCQLKILLLLDEECNNRRNADIVLQCDLQGLIDRYTKED